MSHGSFQVLPQDKQLYRCKTQRNGKENDVQVWIGKGKVNAGESLRKNPTSNWESFPNYLQLKTWTGDRGTAYSCDFQGAILGAT